MRTPWIALVLTAALASPARSAPRKWTEVRFAPTKRRLLSLRFGIRIFETEGPGAESPLPHLPVRLVQGPLHKPTCAADAVTDPKATVRFRLSRDAAKSPLGIDLYDRGLLQVAAPTQLPSEGCRFAIPPAGAAYAAEQLWLSPERLAALPALAKTAPRLDLRADLALCREKRLKRLGRILAELRSRDKALLSMRRPALALQVFQPQMQSIRQAADAADELLALAAALPRTPAGTKAFLASLHARLSIARSCQILEPRLRKLGSRRIMRGLHLITFRLFEGDRKKRVRSMLKRLRAARQANHRARRAHAPRLERLRFLKFVLRKHTENEYAGRESGRAAPAYVTVLDENRVRRFVEKRIDQLEARVGAREF